MLNYRTHHWKWIKTNICVFPALHHFRAVMICFQVGMEHEFTHLSYFIIVSYSIPIQQILYCFPGKQWEPYLMTQWSSCILHFHTPVPTSFFQKWKYKLNQVTKKITSIP